MTTAQYPLEYLEELPGRYCHFLVEQEPINANRDYYLRYWHLLFENLLGWPEAKTNEWAATWDDELNGRNGSFFIMRTCTTTPCRKYLSLQASIIKTVPPIWSGTFNRPFSKATPSLYGAHRVIGI